MHSLAFVTNYSRTRKIHVWYIVVVVRFVVVKGRCSRCQRCAHVCNDLFLGCAKVAGNILARSVLAATASACTAYVKAFVVFYDRKFAHSLCRVGSNFLDKLDITTDSKAQA